MKHRMWQEGVNPLVIANGIPTRALNPVDPAHLATFKEIMNDRFPVLKIGRFDPDKRWMMAAERQVPAERQAPDGGALDAAGVEDGRHVVHARGLRVAPRVHGRVARPCPRTSQVTTRRSAAIAARFGDHIADDDAKPWESRSGRPPPPSPWTS